MDEQKRTEIEEYARKLEAHLDDVAGCMAIILQNFGPQKAQCVLRIFTELVARKLPHLKIDSVWPPPYKLAGKWAVFPYNFQMELSLLSGQLSRDTAASVHDRVSEGHLVQ